MDRFAVSLSQAAVHQSVEVSNLDWENQRLRAEVARLNKENRELRDQRASITDKYVDTRKANEKLQRKVVELEERLDKYLHPVTYTRPEFHFDEGDL